MFPQHFFRFDDAFGAAGCAGPYLIEILGALRIEAVLAAARRELGRLGIRERPGEELEQWALTTPVVGRFCGVLFRSNERTIELANERTSQPECRWLFSMLRFY